MSINKTEQEMIRAIIRNDLPGAKKCALVALTEDTTQKNRVFVEKYKRLLREENLDQIVLPANLEGILIYDDLSTFKENRIYISEHQRKIAEEIHRIWKVSEKLLELQIPYRNATLLYGPPGTGKTTFGRYIAYKMNLPFFYLNFSHTIESYLGKTSRNIANAFSYVSKMPCVFMLDEVDAISSQRDRNDGGAGKEIGRITITLMQEFDRLPNNVIVIAATNRADIIDKAFISRCSNQKEMPPFTHEENKAMIIKFLKDIEMTFPNDEIDRIIQGRYDQRAIMTETIRHIAKRFEQSDMEECECRP